VVVDLLLLQLPTYSCSISRKKPSKRYIKKSKV